MNKINKQLNKQNSDNQKRLVLAFESISKQLANTENVFPKKSLGGQLLATGVSFIPGGQAIAPIISGIDKWNDNQKASFEQASQEMQNSIKKTTPTYSSIYGEIKKMGGHINSGFKQYNTGSHNSGMDQSVDVNGNPSSNTAALIQNKENSFKINGKPFVMSDTLVNPLTGNTFNVDAAKINKKYKNADMITEDKNALNFEMGKLANINQRMINVKESIEKAMGGYLKPDGGVIMPKAIQTTANSTYINPIPFMVKESLPDKEIIQTPVTSLAGYDPTSSGSSKSKSRERFREKALGNFIEPPKTNSIFDLGLTVDNNTEYTDSVPPSDNMMFTTPSVYTRNNQPLNTIPVKSEPIKIDTSKLNINSVETKNPNKVLNNIQNRVNERNDRGLDSTNNLDINYNAVAAGLKGLALMRSGYNATRPYREETLITPDYAKADRQMYKSGYDYAASKQAAVGAANMMSNVNRSAGQNFAQYQARQSQNFGNLSDALSNILQQETNQRVGLDLTRANYEIGKATDIANRRYQNRIDNMQNEANRDFATDKFFSDLSQVGSTFNEYQYHLDMVKNNKELTNAKINEGLMLIGSNYTNFGFTEDFIEKLKKGQASIDEQVKFISTTEKLKKQ